MLVGLFLPLSLKAGKSKFVPDIIVNSKDDNFTDYQIRKTVYLESFFLNRFLGNENPKSKVKLYIDEDAKYIKYEIDRKNKSLIIYLNYRLISGRGSRFREDLVNYMILNEYSQNDYLANNRWIVQGCWSFVRKNLDKAPNEREDFPFAKMLFSNNAKLSSESIINFDAKEGNDLFEVYYSEVSELLISTIMRLPHGKEVLNEYLQYPHPADRYSHFSSLINKSGYNVKMIDDALNTHVIEIASAYAHFPNQTNPEIEKYLQFVEQDKIPFGCRYNIYFSAVDKNSDLLKKIWPQLDAFLNKEYPMKF